MSTKLHTTVPIAPRLPAFVLCFLAASPKGRLPGRVQLLLRTAIECQNTSSCTREGRRTSHQKDLPTSSPKFLRLTARVSKKPFQKKRSGTSAEQPSRHALPT